MEVGMEDGVEQGRIQRKQSFIDAKGIVYFLFSYSVLSLPLLLLKQQSLP